MSKYLESLRETKDYLFSSAFIIDKIDNWNTEQKEQFLKAYTKGNWNMVYNMANIDACALMKAKILEDLAFAITEELYPSRQKNENWR